MTSRDGLNVPPTITFGIPRCIYNAGVLFLGVNRRPSTEAQAAQISSCCRHRAGVRAFVVLANTKWVRFVNRIVPPWCSRDQPGRSDRVIVLTLAIQAAE